MTSITNSGQTGRNCCRFFLESRARRRFDLGRSYLQLKAYTEANSDFDSCLARRGEATAVLLDDIPSYRVFTEVYYYMGRTQEGLQSPGAAKAYQTFVEIRQKSQADALVVDARRRLGDR